MQLPPLFSALKMNGKPLYEYAREGKPIPKEIERRPVEVSEMTILEWMEGGTHNYEAPTEDAEYAEINIANELWKQEGALPASTKTDSEEALDSFESKKRKLDDAQDDLVSEKPLSKHRKSISSQDVTMSGGLPPPSSDPSPAPKVETEKDQARVKGPPAVRIRMTVTSGFYVRSLAHDLGTAVGSAALMAELERTRQAEFELGKNVLEYKDLEKGEEVWGPKVEAFLDAWDETQNSSKKNSSQKNYSQESGQSSKSDGNGEDALEVESDTAEADKGELSYKAPLPKTDALAEVAADPARPVAL